MISIISCNNNGKEDAAEEEPKVGFNSAGGGDGSSGDVGLNSSGPSEEVTASHEDTVKSEEPGVPEASSEVMNESGVSEMKIEENKSGDASEVDSENQASFCIPTDSGDGEPDDKRPSPKVVDYESQLKGFDEIVAKGKGEAVGNGYEIGDLVWGKVKSHPWWPGHIYNEAFATPSVRRTKHEGHVLVAFFGDGSYGWFEPAELIPFEKNFAEKSRQTLSRSFLKAVEEAVDEVSRRRGLGLICRCRNQFNLWPTSVNGYFIAEVPGYEPNAVYSSSQIEKARSSFLPREMLAFLQQLALKPLTDEYWMLNFIKNKATILACRKALFEEYDETYAQAFGTEFVRPVRPTAPPVIDSSKDPLSGRLVVAEALGKTKSTAKPIRMKDQIEKDRYLFKRRDGTNEFKFKKAKLGQSGPSSHPLVQDGLHIPGKLDYSGMSEHVRLVPEPGVSEGHNLPTTRQASAEGLHREKIQEVSSGPKKLLDSATKKAKLHKRPAGEMSTKNSVLADKKKKKRKKEVSNRASSGLIQMPVTMDNVGAAVERSTATSAHVSMAENRLPTMETWQPIGIGTAEFELSVLLRDLQALALDPFHGVERRSPAIIRQVFSKFRSLVYQKSLAVSAPAENDLNEAASASKPAARAPASSTENMKEVPVAVKPIKPPIKHDDPVKSGKKRGPSDRLEEIAAKKKKRLVDVKSLAAEKKAGLKAVDVPRGDVKEVAAKNVQPAPKKALKLETSKKEQRSVKAAERTMLVMKFPPGGALPSIAELKAKFARFGPLDHSATRVFWKSYTCRLVYQYKAHAQAALRFASGSGNLFGNANVRCYLREMESEGQETEPAKVQRDDSSAGASQQHKEYAVEQRIAPKLAQQQPPSQLKSCLKKSSVDEAGGNGISGGGKSTRVKFVLGGEETQLYSSGNENNNSANFHEGASSTNSVDPSSKNIAKIISSPLTSNHQFQNMRSNMPFSSEQVSGPFNASLHIVPRTNNDIAQQMINLLTKCNDVVNNLSGVLGYVPYHPL